MNEEQIQPFHEGEISVQARAGVRAEATRVGAIIQDEMPPAARQFLARQPMVVLGYAGGDGAMWASILTGPPGFAESLDARTVVVDAEPGEFDPLREAWVDGTSMGLLAIELSTRRRIRVNGTLARAPGGRMTLQVQEAFSNCPKYIQARQIVGRNRDGDSGGRRSVERSDRLSARQQRWVATADTLFIASAHPKAGADVSHRGGAPGFARVSGDGGVIIFPDYSGNNMFNTLGNLEANPRAGLLFVDFTSGDTLQLTGTARIDWDTSRMSAYPGAHRLVEFRIAQARHTAGAVPLLWRTLDPSPFNP